METSKDTKLNGLLARLVEETISAEEFSELEEILDGNPRAQERYLHYLGLHRDLQQSGSMDSAGEGRRRVRRMPVAWMAVSGAAAALVIGGIAFLMSDRGGSSQSNADAPIARIVEWNGPMTWTGNGGQVVHHLVSGEALGGGTLESLTPNSWAKIAFEDGTKVSVSGRAVVTLSEGKTGKVIRLREGDISVDATPQPADRPLRLVTRSAEAEVLGTQFNVSANASRTRLTVNEGLVRVTRLADGSVQEVRADHLVVAALERGKAFAAIPRGEYAKAWKSDFPRNVRQGKWNADDGSVRAESHLFRGDRGERENSILLHSVVVGPSGEETSPILLTKGARFRIVGRIAESHRVSFGFGTHRVRGGLAGKYDLSRRIDVRPQSGGVFEIELGVEEFPPLDAGFPESPVGHELVWLWIQTVKEDVGLKVISVELLDSES